MNAPEPIEALLARSSPAGEPVAPLSSVFTRHSHPIVVTDAQRRIQWVNQAFIDLTGYSLEEARGRHPGALLQCEDTDHEAIQRLRQSLNAGQRATARLLNRTRSGRRHFVELDIQPFGPPGQPPEGYIAVQPETAARANASDRLRTLFDCLAAGLVVQDDSGRIIDCNPAAEALLGLCREQLLGLASIDPRWRALDHEGRDLPGEQHPAMRTLRSGQPVLDTVMGVALPDGQRRWLMVNTTPLPRDDGPTWVVSSFTDVTARREMEVQLKAQWERLRTTLEGTRTAAWEWNVQTGLVSSDERLAEILGLSLADIDGFRMQDYMALSHRDDIAASKVELQRHLAGQVEFYGMEGRFRHRDGGWRWIRSRGRLAHRTADGQPLLMFGTTEDITQRKEAELAAGAVQLMLQGLFDASPVGISRVDLVTRAAVDFNPAMCQMLGRSREDLLADGGLGQHFAPESRDARWQALALALEKGSFGPREAVMLHASGRHVNVVMSGARVLDESGHPFLWSVVQDISGRKRMEAELRVAAEQDALTGLPNRHVLMARLTQMQERALRAPGYRFAVMFLDFDRFKLVNDTLGHAAGDELLVMLAQRLRSVLSARVAEGAKALPAAQDHSFVARFGGDEFVYVAAGIDGEREALAIAERLQAALALPYEVKGQVIQSGVSIGLAMGDSGEGVPHVLLRNADTAMYEAKQNGRGSTVVFDQAMHARLSRAVQIEAGLRLAVERGELTVLYQPIVDLENGQMSSVEALLRWQHPELGSVSPAEFIPIAEDSGHIVPIGEWVLRQACLQWARWQQQDAAAAPAGMSVNLSRVQMQLGNRLLQVVRSALSDAGMPASALQLEITERLVMKDPAAARELMLGMNAMGVRLAMDDFGTGSSSLGCLRDYPFDTIKIDKSFVTDLSRDPHVLAVAHATVNVIENLRMTSVAEGIEDPAEVAMLQAMGCRYGQGYLFARPLAADQLLAVMAEGLG